MLTTLSIITVGFSLIAAGLLLVVYLFFLNNVDKSAQAKTAGILLLSGLSALQFEHLQFLLQDTRPLDTLYYRALLFVIPSMFFFFSRAILFGSKALKPLDILHLAPLSLVFFVIKEIAVPLAFLLGAIYCLWLVHLIYSLKAHRKRFELEFFFFGFFAVIAVVVLIFGFSLTYIRQEYFYYFYANGISLAFLLIIAALIISPELIQELKEAVKLSYSNSTLTNVNEDLQLDKLNKLMIVEQVYQNENLTLALLAESMELSAHQLSELINKRFGIGFSRYIREQRVTAAKRLLLEQPSASVLAIGLETGFKSQSNFYAAFKEITELSPGQYRKEYRQ